MAKLTDAQLREWVRAGKSIAGKSDGDGLTFTLSANGAASWTLRYRLGGRLRELTLGRYPDISLKEARRRAAEQRAKIAAGIDVAAEKRRARIALAAVSTVKELAEDYMVRVAPGLSDATQRETRRYLDKDILPRIGHLKLTEATPTEVVYVIEQIAKRSATVARRAFEILSVIFAHGVAKHVAPQNPCASLKPAAIIGVTRPRRARIMLKPDELRATLAALPRLGVENTLAVKILLATCVRKGELIRARWPHLDLERGLWTIPEEHIKSRTSRSQKRDEAARNFVIPLPPTVVGWFQALRAMAGESAYVLPARVHRHGREDRPINSYTLNAALDRLNIDVRRFTPHDLRSTARSYLTSRDVGVDVIVAERCLNHSLGGLVAVYDQHDYMEERREALERWATFIENCERPCDAKVLPIKKSVAA